jgi:hypothetical protein
VVDEADRLLDMGFEPDLRELLGSARLLPPGRRQSAMLSATLGPEVQRLAADFLRDHVYVSAGAPGASTELISQELRFIGGEEKKVRGCLLAAGLLAGGGWRCKRLGLCGQHGTLRGVRSGVGPRPPLAPLLGRCSSAPQPAPARPYGCPATGALPTSPLPAARPLSAPLRPPCCATWAPTRAV